MKISLSPLQYHIPNAFFPMPALISEQPGWSICSDSIGCVRVCVYSSYEGLSVWLWKSISWPSSWHLLLQNASAPIGIYAVNIRLENPDLSTIQMTLFSLKSSVDTFILWIYTLMEPQNPILNLNGGLYIWICQTIYILYIRRIINTWFNLPKQTFFHQWVKKNNDSTIPSQASSLSPFIQQSLV